MDNKPRESVTTVNLDGADHVASPVGRRRSTLRQALSQGGRLEKGSAFLRDNAHIMTVHRADGR